MRTKEIVKHKIVLYAVAIKIWSYIELILLKLKNAKHPKAITIAKQSPYVRYVIGRLMEFMGRKINIKI